jgi:ABC-type Fe3+-hydroxamate transport system substrate-binding protein
MLSYTDQTGRTIELPATPQRIISLVPSQTELLAYLGLQQEVIGITKFCIHPAAWFQQKTRIGGTKQLDIEKIHAVKPDFIIANKEENVKEQVEELARHYPVWISDVTDLESAYEMINAIGQLVNKVTKADQLISAIKTNFNTLPLFINKPKAAYLIWRNPYMTVSGDTFIHHMLTKAGFENVYANDSRYPSITVKELTAKAPEVLFLSSEPYPFQQKHVTELKEYLPDTTIILADGEMFSWYGSRLLLAPAYFLSVHTIL